MSTRSQQGTVRSADGASIGFVKLGAGPPLVLVHGSVSAGDSWLPVATALADRFACYVVDRRGRGGSGDGPAYALAREGEDIQAVLGLAGPGAHLLGHSYGALCALEAARRGTVERLVLYEPPLAVTGRQVRDLLAGYRAALERNQPEEALKLFLRNGPEVSDPEIEAIQQTPLWPQMVALAPTLTRELEAIRDLDGDPEPYRAVSAPTLLLVGTESSAALKAGSNDLQATMPRARTLWLEGQAHIANLLVPDRVAREVAAFLLEGDAPS